jgi:hypothetical protein
MNKYLTNQRICQELNPLERQIYQKLLLNSNKNKKKQQLFTRKTLKKYLHYALGSIANALQILRNKGLILYNKTTKTWSIIIRNHDSIDIYDLHIKFKQDWFNFIPIDEWRQQRE